MAKGGDRDRKEKSSKDKSAGRDKRVKDKDKDKEKEKEKAVPFPIGCLVQAYGLSNKEFNGKKGKVKKYKKDRVVVTFPPPDNDCALRFENVCSVTENTRQSGVKRARSETPEAEEGSSLQAGPDSKAAESSQHKADKAATPQGGPSSAPRRDAMDEDDSYSSSRSPSPSRSESSSASQSEDDYESSEEEERWVKVLFEPPPQQQQSTAPPTTTPSPSAGPNGEPPRLATMVSPDEVFWLYTQFGSVSKVMVQPRNTFFLCMLKRDKDAISYFRGKTVAMECGSFQVRTQPAQEPPYGQLRDYTAINKGLRELLLKVSAEDAADGLEIFFDTNKWAKRDFIWSRWVAGDGWLEPRQEEELIRKMPTRIKTDDKYVHVGNLWENALQGQIHRLASVYGTVDMVSNLRRSDKSAFCIVKFAETSAARLFMKHMNMTGVHDRRLRVDSCTDDVSRHNRGLRMREKMDTPRPSAPSNSVLVTGLSEEVFSAFARYGHATGCTVHVTSSSDTRAKELEESRRERRERDKQREKDRRGGRRSGGRDRSPQRGSPPPSYDFVVAFRTTADAVLFIARHNLMQYRGRSVQLSFYDTSDRSDLGRMFTIEQPGSDRPEAGGAAANSGGGDADPRDRRGGGAKQAGGRERDSDREGRDNRDGGGGAAKQQRGKKGQRGEEKGGRRADAAKPRLQFDKSPVVEPKAGGAQQQGAAAEDASAPRGAKSATPRQQPSESPQAPPAAAALPAEDERIDDFDEE